MSADLLRRAAEKIRSRSALATRELDGDPWDITDPGEASDIENHIALWSPDVAKSVASALEGTADFYELVGPVSRTHPPYGLMEQARTRALFRMLALARRILGEDA